MLTIYSTDLKDNKELFKKVFELIKEDKLLIVKIGYNFIIVEVKNG